MKIQLNEKQKFLHERAVYLGLRHEKMEYTRVENLIEIEANEVHKAFGKKMFVYATEILAMDPGLAYPYIAVARACVKFPKLRDVLRAKKLSVTKAGRIVSSLNKENAEDLIQFAQTHSKREIEDEVVKRNPKARTRDQIRSLNSEFDEFRVTLRKNVSKNFRRVQALNPSLNLAQIAEEMIEFYLNQKDPVRKAERVHKRAERAKIEARSEAEVTSKADVSAKNYARAEKAKRISLTAAQKHKVRARDRGCCTFVDAQGKRCNSDRWTEMHHIVRVSDGGTNDPTNLTTLCSFHHDLIHQLSLPIEGQVTWLR